MIVKEIIIFLFFLITGLGLLISSFLISKSIVIIFLGIFFILGLINHFNDLELNKVKDINRDNIKYIKILVSAITGVIFSWFINHEMGYGAVLASSIVGVIASLIFPSDMAGTIYTASFVGMSSLDIIPNINTALFIGIMLGIIIILSERIYSGIGGKGGTTACLSTIISKSILEILG